MADAWILSSYQKQRDLLMDLGWGLYSGLTGAIVRAYGNEALEAFTERLVNTHQRHYFLEGLGRLGLDHEPSDAIKCAKYHYLSNMVGGLRMGYAEESPDKAWVFYLSPNPMFEFGTGISFLRPEYWLSVVRGWHSHNGESLGNPCLVAVVTHSIFRGDPYDAVYFLDTGERQAPGDRARVNWGEAPPEMILGDLDPRAWPERRRLRGLRGYLAGYIGGIIYHLLDAYGPGPTASIVRHAWRVLLFQRLDAIRRGLQIPSDHAFPTAIMLKRIQQVFLEDASLEDSPDQVTVRQETNRLRRVPEFQQEGALAYPVEVEEAITDAWAALTRHITPGVTVRLTASMARGEGRLEWVFRRDRG